MLALILALMAAADPPPKTVSPVTVPAGPSTVIEKRPSATLNSPGGTEDVRGEYVAIWPKAAYAAGKDGRVTLSCLIDVHGLAEWCKVAAESPPGQGFGKAALELRPTFKMAPKAGPNGPVESMQTINVGFRSPDFRIDQAELAREMWKATHDPNSQFMQIEVPVTGNRLQMHRLAMLDNPVWAQAASFEDLGRAYPAKGGGIEGYAAAHCKVERQGPQAGSLGGCTIIKESPHEHGFGAAALSLTGRFRVQPEALAKIPQTEPLWVDVPIRFPPPDELAKRAVTAPVWLTTLDTAVAAPTVFPIPAIEKGLRQGRGVARCTVTVEGDLTDCAADGGDPDGFGAAAAKLAPMMKVNLWSADGAPVAGGVVRFPVELKLPGADG